MPNKAWMKTAVEIKKVLSLDDGRLRIGGVEATDAQLANLKSDAELLGKATLWPLLVETVRAEAVKVGINKSTNFDHVITAKAVLLMLDWMETWTDVVRRAQFRKPKP